MSFLYRLGYYLGGFSAGLVILFFLFNGKRTQCNYGPEARVLNNLSEKHWQAKTTLLPSMILDSITVQTLLKMLMLILGQVTRKEIVVNAMLCQPITIIKTLP